MTTPIVRHEEAGKRASRRSRLARPMGARDPGEAHRVSTPLELLFDLCFVVAVAQGAARLHHALVEGHFGEGVLGYVLVFFAIWWAWMNFTWFASAYDTDDTLYRVTVLVQIAGVLVLAAGIPRAFDARDFTIVTLGYAIMRTALVAHWSRAAFSDGAHRRTAMRYVCGLVAVQVGWIAALGLARPFWLVAWCLLVPLELLVPIWAERARPTAWHPHHIAERYGLFTIIVLGESVLSATLAIQSAVDAGLVSSEMVALIVGGILILFSMWWIYFDNSAHRFLHSMRAAFLWGYGHLIIFAASAAVGAGIAASADAFLGRGHISVQAAGASVAVPVALYLLSVWAIHIRPGRRGRLVTGACLLATILILVSSFSTFAVLLIGLILVALVATCVLTGSPQHEE
jgi:low temperature requirement protein LtrA